MQEVYEFLKNCGIFYIATTEGNQPRVRPFGAVNIFDDKLYVQTGRVKKVSKQIETNPLVEICGYNNGVWVRVEGRLIRDDRIDAKISMLEANPMLKGMYSAKDDNTEVLYFEKALATFYSFTDDPREVKF